MARTIFPKTIEEFQSIYKDYTFPRLHVKSEWKTWVKIPLSDAEDIIKSHKVRIDIIGNEFQITRAEAEKKFSWI